MQSELEFASNWRVALTDDVTTPISQTVRVDGHLVTISCRYLPDRNLWEPTALIRPAWDAGASLELATEPQGCRGTIDDSLDVATDLVVAWLRDQPRADLRRLADNPSTPKPASISAS